MPPRGPVRPPEAFCRPQATWLVTCGLRGGLRALQRPGAPGEASDPRSTHAPTVRDVAASRAVTAPTRARGQRERPRRFPVAGRARGTAARAAACDGRATAFTVTTAHRSETCSSTLSPGGHRTSHPAGFRSPPDRRRHPARRLFAGPGGRAVTCPGRRAPARRARAGSGGAAGRSPAEARHAARPAPGAGAGRDTEQADKRRRTTEPTGTPSERRQTRTLGSGDAPPHHRTDRRPGERLRKREKRRHTRHQGVSASFR